MRRRPPWLLAAAGLLSGSALAADRTVPLPDGRRMHLNCQGSGTPVVLFEGGWQAGVAGWAAVQARVAAETTACAYDRAGTGGSDPGPLPRSAAAIAGDLKALAAAAGLSPPVVLVAHSLGALPARLLAADPARPVAALLLVDPSVEYQPQRMGGTPAVFDPMIARARDTGHPDQASELEALPALSSDQVAQAGPPPADLPLLVLTAGRSQPDPALQASWAALHKGIGGEQRVVPDAGHMLPRDRPDAVADAALELVRRVRAVPSRR